MIPKSTVTKVYGLTDYDLCLLNRIEKTSFFSSKTVSLYLEKDVLELIDETYGSIDNLRKMNPQQRSTFTRYRKKCYSDYETTLKLKVEARLQNQCYNPSDIELLMHFVYPLYKPMVWGHPDNLKCTFTDSQIVSAITQWFSQYKNRLNTSVKTLPIDIRIQNPVLSMEGQSTVSLQSGLVINMQ
jgi:hypothetical protein